MKDAAAAVLVCAVEGRQLSLSERQFFESVAVSGVTLFGRNIDQDNHSAVRLLVNDLQQLRPPSTPDLVIAIDQEGGRVARLKAPFPNRGPAIGLAPGLADLDARNDIKGYGAEVGQALTRLGINVNFAPVVDVLSEPANLAIGDRAFGTDARSVILRGEAFLDGLQSTGVKGCLKHFPGQGDAKVDTHIGTAVVHSPAATLEQRELAPFRALLHKAPMVMIAHCIYPAFAPEEASRSPIIMQEILRKRLQYEGVIVSDDMTMGAIPQDEKEWQAILVEAVRAGADMLLVCRHLERFRLAHEALTREAKSSESFAMRLTEAANRVLCLRKTLPRCL